MYVDSSPSSLFVIYSESMLSAASSSLSSLSPGTIFAKNWTTRDIIYASPSGFIFMMSERISFAIELGPEIRIGPTPWLTFSSFEDFPRPLLTVITSR